MNGVINKNIQQFLLVGSVLVRDELNSIVMECAKRSWKPFVQWRSSSGYKWHMVQRICAQNWSLWWSACVNVGFAFGFEVSLTWWNFTSLLKVF